LKALNILDSGS